MGRPHNRSPRDRRETLTAKRPNAAQIIAKFLRQLADILARILHALRHGQPQDVMSQAPPLARLPRAEAGVRAHVAIPGGTAVSGFDQQLQDATAGRLRYEVSSASLEYIDPDGTSTTMPADEQAIRNAIQMLILRGDRSPIHAGDPLKTGAAILLEALDRDPTQAMDIVHAAATQRRHEARRGSRAHRARR
ncbi:hypothetical protein QWY28_22130 [Nocardioides sp. SOB77]|uniref:DUF222 domain-containing protein n=1 Tax=Nocardioides oceani TaxID=3058369 RepID=A0ABT8FN93_9ACTN|nr:hypothetical protein [Nocardioides oceani]MDN4175677.1 hypothetical protein [Nocardioides oceani]